MVWAWSVELGAGSLGLGAVGIETLGAVVICRLPVGREHEVITI
jgi:hypothetical protein